MRLNFWQWIGLALLIVGGSLWIYRETSKPANSPTIDPNATTQPVTRPGTTAPSN